MPDAFRVFAGVDWAQEVHVVCVTDATGRIIEERQVPHEGQALAEMADWLVALASGQADEVAVAIEVPHGAIVDTLLDRGCHVFAVNPKQLDRFRDRLFPAGAKDDSRDAFVLGDALRTDSRAFRRLAVGDPLMLQLREASRQDAELQEDFQRVVNRLHDLLVRVWPELLSLAPSVNEPWLWTLLRFAPTPSAGAALPVGRVRRILREHHIRRVTAEEVAAVLRAPSVHLAAGVREGTAPRIASLLEQLWLLHGQRHAMERRQRELLQALNDEAPAEKGREHQDVAILQSLPGIGVRIAATMLAEAAHALQARDYHGLRTLGGIAPITKKSGKSRQVQMRYACQRRVRTALYWWGMGAIRCDPLSHVHYQRLRAKGQTHGRALRGVIDRLLSVLVAMLKNDSLYDASRRHPAATAA
jgi:hypothetical protein